MSDETIDLSYAGKTTKRDRQFDAENLMAETRAVFPELPAPFNHMYVRFKDLNSDSSIVRDDLGIGNKEDRMKHPAVEVGLKFTF